MPDRDQQHLAGPVFLGHFPKPVERAIANTSRRCSWASKLVWSAVRLGGSSVDRTPEIEVVFNQAAMPMERRL